MKAEFINVFIMALISVSEMMFQEKPALKETFKKTTNTTLLDVAVVVGLTGNIKGQVVINFSKETGMNIASIMMGGMPVETMDDMTKSALAEIGNMVMGTASTALSQLGVTTDITPPHLIIGDHMTMMSREKTIVVSFDSNLGDMLLEISLDL